MIGERMRIAFVLGLISGRCMLIAYSKNGQGKIFADLVDTVCETEIFPVSM